MIGLGLTSQAVPHMMSTDPLYTICQQCGGTGQWTQPPEQSGNCVTRFGSQECPKCDGFGMVFSETGQEVVDIILRLRRMGRLH